MDDVIQNIKDQITIDNKKEIKLVIDKLEGFLKIHIMHQIKAGADTIQIFDSWAGLIFPEDLPNYCYIPNLKIVEFCKMCKILSN